VPDALSGALLAYRAFEMDADHSRQRREERQMVKFGNMILRGANSIMAREFYEDSNMGVVKYSGQDISEEIPDGFVKQILRFIEGRK
jgi:hypothetical protein